jgi:putative transposase
MGNLLRIRERSLVSHDGVNWIIVHVEDTQRVLASRVADGRHEFLLIENLKPAIKDQSDGVDAGDPVDGLEPPLGTKSRNYLKIINRTIRPSQATSTGTRETFDALDGNIDEFHDILKILNTPKPVRRPLIEALCEKFAFTIATAYRRISLVKAHGVPEVLHRPVRSDKGKRRISPDVLALANSLLAKHRFIAEPETLPKVLRRVNGHCRRNGWPEISAFALQSIEKETSLKEKLLLQGRPDKARDLYRPKLGHLPNADFPLALVQIDHTPIQVTLVDMEYRLPIKSPSLSLVIDSYSRMVLGFFLSFDAPSTLSTGVAMAHAFLPKEQWLKRLQVPGEWPCWGFPDVIQVDNGADLNGAMMHEVRRKYRVVLRNRPVDAPNFGGHVESAFRTFLFEQKATPGTKFSNPQQRGEYVSEDHAVLTLPEFEQLFTEFLVNDYHLAPHSGEGMDGKSPLQKWRQGLFEGDTFPPVGLPGRPIDELGLKISLLPTQKRVVAHSKVNIFTEEYYAPELAQIGDYLSPEIPKEQRKFEIRYDPRDVSMIWLLDPRTDKYIELRFTDLKKPSISLWDLKARNKQKGQSDEAFEDQRFNSIERRDDIVDTARKRTKKQRIEDEKKRHRAEGAISRPATPPQRPIAATTGVSQLTREELDLLRQQWEK